MIKRNLAFYFVFPELAVDSAGFTNDLKLWFFQLL